MTLGPGWIIVFWNSILKKTNVLFIGKQHLLDKFPMILQSGCNSYSSNIGDKIKLLGTYINENLSCRDTMKSCVESSYFNLHKLQTIRQVKVQEFS